MRLNIASQDVPENLLAEGPGEHEDDFAEAFAFPTAKGGGKRRSAEFVSFRVVRELYPSDVASILEGNANVPTVLPSLKSIRSSHHQLAQLLSQGIADEDAALMTGYTPSYISRIKGDPTFSGLMSHYSAIREIAFVDVVARMKALGVDALEELQERLADDPAKFSNREIQEIVELMLVKPMTSRGSGMGGNVSSGSSPTINISFKSSGSESVGLTIDAKVEGDESAF